VFNVILKTIYWEAPQKDCWGYVGLGDRLFSMQCDNCGKEFESSNERRKYCSDKCRDQGGIQNRKKQKAQARKCKCQVCGETFIPPRKDAKFCSDKCRQTAYRDRKKELEPIIKTKVAHCMKEPYDIYIGRYNRRKGLKASKWANPFKIDKDGTREEVIKKYKQWFFTQPDLVSSIPELKGKVLGCWCKPDSCHGDFLAELANKLQ
jgi:predicted nucleic acid-binding Zn ribbon protein